MKFFFKLKSISFVGIFCTAIIFSMIGVYARNVPKTKRQNLFQKDSSGLSINVIQEFIETGDIKDYVLKNAIKRSGWSEQEVQEGIKRIYKVDKISLERLIKSSFGVNLLAKYHGDIGLNKDLVNAILDDSIDGTISSIGILAGLKALPRDISECINSENQILKCDRINCSSDDNCKTVLTWYIFLPACLQASQFSEKSRSNAYQRYC